MMTLVEWMTWKGYGDTKMGRLIGVSRVSVSRYRHGRIPEWSVMVRIWYATGGLVSPNSWLPMQGRKLKKAA